MDRTSWLVHEFEAEAEAEGPAQLELFPEPRVFTAVKPRQTTGILRDCTEGAHPPRFDFSGLEQRYYYARSVGKSTATDTWWDEYYDFSTLRTRTISSWDAQAFSGEESSPVKPKKNIQPGPKPSLNARKKW